jgi:hypothetical protein
MQICRAEDGQIYQVNTTLYDIAKSVYVSASVYIVGCIMGYDRQLTTSSHRFKHI